MRAEGWYVDPYGQHEARWFSDGTPTALVRDGRTESHDPPPRKPYAGDLEPIAAHGHGPEDLRRADDRAVRFDARIAADAAFDVFAKTSGSD